MSPVLVALVALIAIGLGLGAFYVVRAKAEGTKVPSHSGTDIAGVANRMAQLEQLGIRLLPPFTIDGLKAEMDFIIGHGYWGLLYSLAMPQYNEETYQETRRCNVLYGFDTESISSNEGDYADRIKSLAAITGGALQITSAKDSFAGWDKEGEPLHVTIDLVCNGKPVHWKFDQDTDYFESHVAEKLQDLLSDIGSDLTYFAIEPDGQEAIIGCLPRLRVKEFETVTGLKTLSAPEGIRRAVSEGREFEEKVALEIAKELAK
jgi:hypothetical protein